MQLTVTNPSAAVWLAEAGFAPTRAEPLAGPRIGEAAAGERRLRETFKQFVGEVFFGQLLKAMRKTVGEPAYFSGGRAEEVFRGQLDQVLAEKLARQAGAQLADPMFALFRLSRR